MADRRDEILTAAREILAEEGVSGMSVRAVARRVGIGASTLRHYFPTQRDLIGAVTDLAYQRLVSDLDIGSEQRDPAERLSECLAQFLPPHDEGAVPLAQLWATRLYECFGPDADEAERHMMNRLYSLALERTRGWLRTLAAEGALPAAAVDDRAVSLVAFCDGLMPQLLAQAVPADRARMLAELEWFCRAVLACPQ